MADINASAAQKVPLPPGWIVRFSKKHPDRPCYFNELTGQARWSLPTEEDEKVKKVSQRGKKRKTVEVDEEEEDEDGESSDATNAAAKKLLNAIINNRPKLKAKGSLNDTANESNDDLSRNGSTDTPAMRLYREKMAQRKAAQEAKKSGSKTSGQKKNQASLPVVKVPQASTPSTSQTTPRRTRRSSVVSSNESVSSNASTLSTSSLGSKVAALAKRTATTPPSPVLSANKKLPKIPKVQLVRHKLLSTKADALDSDTLTDTSNADNNDQDEIQKFNISNQSLKKNYANERLENFRKSLEKSPNKRHCGKSNTSNNNNNSIPNTPSEKSKLLNSPPPILRDKAQIRLYSLEERVESSCHSSLNKSKVSDDDQNKSIIDKVLIEKAECADLFCEEMEWEPIEDEKIMSEVYSVRHQLCNESDKPVDKLWGELPCDELRTLNMANGKNALYIVIDTNVFLSNLPFIEEVRDSHSDIFGRPFIVVPWTVLQELDYIKDDKNKERSQPLKIKARKAVDFLNRHFAAKHPRFLGQTPMDVQENKEKFMSECPDDEILQTCLQIKEWSKAPVLLSYDKNLCNKAMIHDIPTLGKNEPIEKIYYLKAAETTDFFANSLHSHLEETVDDLSTSQQELLVADDIMEEGKAVLKSVLSAVVAKEMKILFGDRWELHVIERPPWSVHTVLKCALKHWIAAVSESFIRKTELMLRDVQSIIKNSPDCGRKLQDVKHFLNKCNEVFQTLNNTKYPSLKSQALNSIETLKERCENSAKEISSIKFKEIIGSEDDACEAEKRANLAFKVLEDVYAFGRDLCGIAAERSNMNCAFTYNKAHPFITPEMACKLLSEVGTSVNKLIQTLRVALSKVEEGIQPSDRIIIALHETLVNFCSDLNTNEMHEVSPLDIYCCVKLRKNMLEWGYVQLQELAVHFCRLASKQYQ